MFSDGGSEKNRSRMGVQAEIVLGWEFRRELCSRMGVSSAQNALILSFGKRDECEVLSTMHDRGKQRCLHCISSFRV